MTQQECVGAGRWAWVAVLAVLGVVVPGALGHGRLIEPPARSSAWRFGFDTPPNYSDNQMFCGGKQTQWNQNGGKCGVCGDPFQGPLDHEVGGRFYKGTIVRTYQEGAEMEVTMELTANHLGWMEIRLCPNNDPSASVTQECLDQYVLPLVGGAGNRVTVLSNMRMITVRVQLPQGVTCTNCMVQWKYNTGNSWGNDFTTGAGCLGCGPQEQFYGCADVAIESGNGGGIRPTRPPPPTRKPTSRPTARPSTRRPPTVRPTAPPTARPTARPTGAPPSGNCRAIGSYASRPGFHEWCVNNCRMGFCPADICKCS